jgi:hypothetical protein
MFDGALVVINKKAGRPESFAAKLFHLLELNGTCDRVRSATVEPTLLVNRRALRSEIDSHWKVTDDFWVGHVMQIAVVRQVRDPAVEMLWSASAARQPGFFTANAPRHASSCNKMTV